MSDSWLGLLHAITGRLLAERQLRQDPAPLFEELVCVSPDAFGLLLRLEHAGVIDAAAREEILDRALALCEEEIGEEEIREISRHVLEAAGRDGSAADDPEADRPRARHLH
jgi:uncharacterized protein Smg (DUF494 family)